MTRPHESSLPSSYPSNTAHPSRGSHIFQPPKSPAFTTASIAATSSNDYFSPRSRKRQRPDSSHSQLGDEHQQTPGATITPSWIECTTPLDATHLSSAASVNEKYRLAGGFDTPGLMATSENEQYQDAEFRRRVRDLEPAQREDSKTSQLSGPLARERNGVARMPSSPNGNQASLGWTSYALGLVGKMFSFGTNVIKGFYAGSGRGFDLQNHDAALSDSWMHAPRGQRGSTPVPGAWQSDEFLGDLEQDNPVSPTVTTSSRPPNKRRQTDKDSWVMVGTPEVSVEHLSPKRKVSSTSVPRPSLAVRPTASRANSRRSLAPVSRRQSSYVSYSGSPAHQQQPQHLQSTSREATQALNRRASIAPTRASLSRPGSSGDPQAQSPASFITPEAERYLKRQARQDRAADKTMSHLGKQLEDLIRQGKEALGTKVSVEGGGEEMEVDEGYVDDEW